MRLFFISLLACATAAPLFAQDGKSATGSEKGFSENLRQRMTQILGTAAKSMPGQWTIHFDAARDNDLANKNEFNISLSMEYSPTHQEKLAMEKELAAFQKSMSKKDIIAGNRQNDPTLRYAIEITASINPRNFTPVDLQQAAALGGTIEVMGTALTTLRTKDLGTAAPYYSLFIGGYKTTNTNGKKLLEENFVASPVCCDARAILIEIHSSQVTANNFISKLDIPGLNRIIQEF